MSNEGRKKKKKRYDARPKKAGKQKWIKSQ